MPKTLLLADDSVTIQKVVGISFANEDVILLTVDNGDDAIARAREARPDLVLADVVMPGKNGYEVCAAIKNDPEISATPVMLLTGTFEAFDDSRAREVGADGHITKPFEAQALVDRVNQLLEQAAGHSDSASTPEPSPQAEPASPLTDAFDEPGPANESERFESPAQTPPESWTAPDDFGTTPIPEPTHAAHPAAPPAATSMTPPPIPEVGESSGFGSVPPPVSAAPTPPPVPDALTDGDLGDGPAAEALSGSYDFFEDEFGANATPPSESTSTSYGFGATTDGSLESAMSDEIPSNFDFGDSQIGSPAFPSAETNVTASSRNETASPDSFSDAQTIPPSFDTEFDGEDDEPTFDATTAWERPPTEATEEAAPTPVAPPFEEAPTPVAPPFEEELETTALPEEAAGSGELLHAEDVVEAAEDANFVDDPAEPATTLPLPEHDADDSLPPFEHGFGTADRDRQVTPFSGMDASGSGAAITGMDAPIEAEPLTTDGPGDESTGAFGDAFGSLATESQRPESFQDPAPSGSFDVAHEDVAHLDTRTGVRTEDELPGSSFAETMPISDTERDDSPQGDHDLRSSNPAFRQEIHDAIEKIAWEAMGPVAEAIVRDCVEKVERVAWEVIPEMAEKLIREEIRRLKGEDQ